MNDRNRDLEKGTFGQGLTVALRLLREGRRGKPNEFDRPPPSTFPMTPAARAARRIDTERKRA